MPYLSVNDAKIFYEDHGSGSGTIVFAHGLMFSSRMFEAQIEALKNRYRCIAFDFRSHGKSPASDRGYSMVELTEDATEFIKALDCGPCHFVGLSMGSYVGLRLAIKNPELLKSLTLLGASADRQPKFTALLFRWMNSTASRGPRFRKGVINIIIALMFSKKFRNDPMRAKDKESWQKEMIANYNFKAVKAVVDRTSVYDALKSISIPTLVITGEMDTINPPALGERIHSAIKGAGLKQIPDSGHIATIEEPEAVNNAIAEFLYICPSSTKLGINY